MKLVTILAAFLLAALTVQSQEPQTVDTISIDTNLFSVPVIVSDRDNRYVPDLKIDSFHLFDNQIEQKITYFDTGEEPLNVVLMRPGGLQGRGRPPWRQDEGIELMKKLSQV